MANPLPLLESVVSIIADKKNIGIRLPYNRTRKLKIERVSVYY
jgi:hypothetical protein